MTGGTVMKRNVRKILMIASALFAAVAGIMAWQAWFSPAPLPERLEYLAETAPLTLAQVENAALPPEDNGNTTFTFASETVGAQPQSFVPVVGNWVVGVDEDNKVLVVDGRTWSRGQTASGIAERVRSLYGERYVEFLDNVQAFAYFPYAVASGIGDFGEGEIGVRFKGIAGRIDQAAGILFDLKPNGDYLLVRANPLENNLGLWKFVRGKRRSVKLIRNTPSPSNEWHELKVVIDGTVVNSYLNGVLYLTHDLKRPVSGLIGIWSKADSVVYFDDYRVLPAAQ